MQITQEEVVRISQLARLELTEQELERFQVELSRILDYVDQLNELDTAGVPATAQVTGLENQTRPDVISDVYTRDAMLDSAIEVAEGHIKVKNIFSNTR